MPDTLNTDFPTRLRNPSGKPKLLEHALLRLSPVLARAASETAEAFFPGHTTGDNPMGPDRDAPLPDAGTLKRSQANIGERYEMTCLLAVDKARWGDLFTRGENEVFRMDVLGELANCICGTLLSDPGFLDEFGPLLPCVPSGDYPQAPSDAGCLVGAVRVSGTWIHFTFAIRERTAFFSRSGRFAAAA